MLSEIVEVFQDIVLPWHKELKEKRELLREDPFVGFIVLAAAGAAFYFFTRQSPSWIGFFMHYAGIAMFILGSFAALSAGWFGWGLYQKAAWPTALLVLSIYGCFDTYQVVAENTRQKAGAFRGEEGAMLTVIQTDEIKRFTGRPIRRSVESLDQLAGRTLRRTFAQGPLNSVGKKHGRWEETTLIPKRSAVTVKWYFEDREVTESEWGKRVENR